MKNPTLQKAQNLATPIDQLTLENVTLSQAGMDPVLEKVDFQLPTDQTVLIESSNPTHAVEFLKMLSGQRRCQSGQVLWNGQDFFADDYELDPRDFIGAFFDGHVLRTSGTVLQVLQQFLTSTEALDNVVELFELSPYLNNSFLKLSYSWQKTLTLIKCISHDPQILILEDPAQGLNESQWLNFLDYVQYQQRRGLVRHIFATNHHPTAFNNLEHVKMYLEEGLVYFDETAPVKKIAHF